MTEITFYFNVPERLNYACRLVRKALQSPGNKAQKGVAVLAPSAILSRFDRALWSFDATEFIPHVLLPNFVGGGVDVRVDVDSDAGSLAAKHSRTPVWLVEQAERAAHMSVLLHLGDEPAVGFESFQRLIEVVSADPTERAAARIRWKHYKARGYDIQKHEVGA